jgi:hypothetical protein
MEFFRFELEGIWQFEIFEEHNSIFFSSTSLSIFVFFFFFFLFFFFGTPFCLLPRVSLCFRFFFFFFCNQRLAFENNEIRFRNN